MGTLAAGGPGAAERGLLPTCPLSSPSPLLPSLPSPRASFFPCPLAMANTPQVPPPGSRVPGTELPAAGKELGGASGPGSPGGQTEAQRAEGPGPKPHISRDQTGVKGHLGAQVRLLLPCSGDGRVENPWGLRGQTGLCLSVQPREHSGLGLICTARKSQRATISGSKVPLGTCCPRKAAASAFSRPRVGTGNNTLLSGGNPAPGTGAGASCPPCL